MKKKSRIIALLIIGSMCVSCKSNTQEKEQIKVTEVTTETIEPTNSLMENILIPTVSEHLTGEKEPEGDWTSIEEGTHYLLETLKRASRNCYRYKVFNDNKELVCEEYMGEIVQQPSCKETEEEVNIHFGYGTGVFMDKFVDFKENRQSLWFDSPWAVGRNTVAFFMGDWNDGSKSKIVIRAKYDRSQMREYAFPHFIRNWDVDECEFIENETVLYAHYIDKDTEKEDSVKIPFSDFA